jgi:hypothetical protein
MDPQKLPPSPPGVVRIISATCDYVMNLKYFQGLAGSVQKIPPLLLSFLSPEQLAGPLGASLVALQSDIQNLLLAANR